MAYNLYTAFDKAFLLLKLAALYMVGRPLCWMESYLSGRRQCVVWNGVTSAYVDVEFGVRQGPILGPLLFLLHMSDLHGYLGMGEEDNALYADNVTTWESGISVLEVKKVLEARTVLFTEFARKNGLALNAGKTQLLYSWTAGNERAVKAAKEF
jgi:hypothetical protein